MTRLTFNQFLVETPLLDDWDSTVFNKNTSFKKKIDYAIERSKKIGSGSSRVAFEIEYKGRPTILKIAKNAKGLAQNEEESKILEDTYISDIVIPLIDYDEKGYTWIHTEKAEKVTSSKLCKLMNVPSLQSLVYAADVNSKRRDSFLDEIRTFNKDDEDKIEVAMEYVDKLSELNINYEVELGDLTRAANWGTYHIYPVIIDLGFTYYTKDNFYSK